jgi:hypothetical protein
MGAETCVARPYDGKKINYDWLFNLAYSKATKLTQFRKFTLIEADGRDLLKEDGYKIDLASVVEEEVDLIIGGGVAKSEKWKDLIRVFANFRVEPSLVITGYRDCCYCGIDGWEFVDENENGYIELCESKVSRETTAKRTKSVKRVRIGGRTLGRVRQVRRVCERRLY